MPTTPPAGTWSGGGQADSRQIVAGRRRSASCSGWAFSEGNGRTIDFGWSQRAWGGGSSAPSVPLYRSWCRSRPASRPPFLRLRHARRDHRARHAQDCCRVRATTNNQRVIDDDATTVRTSDRTPRHEGGFPPPKSVRRTRAGNGKSGDKRASGRGDRRSEVTPARVGWQHLAV